MSTKITFIIDNPADPEAFETAYKGFEGSARDLPRLQRFEAGKVWPKENGSPTPAYRTLDLYFDTYDDASAAVATAGARDFMDQLKATGTTFMALFTDIGDE
ncbi:EthD family reductase [Arthrobacter sp. NPDC055585]